MIEVREPIGNVQNYSDSYKEPVSSKKIFILAFFALLIFIVLSLLMISMIKLGSENKESYMGDIVEVKYFIPVNITNVSYNIPVDNQDIISVNETSTSNFSIGNNS